MAGPNVLSKGLARDKRRQKHAGLRLRRHSRKGVVSRRNRSHFILGLGQLTLVHREEDTS